MNKWTSVGYDIPEFNSEVICFWSECDGGIAIGTLNEVRYIHTKDGVQCQMEWTLQSIYGEMQYEVTHWMPLPDPPL